MNIKRPDGKIHKVQKWDRVIEDEITEENDANDYYYSWVDLKENNLIDLFSEALGLNFDYKKILIKIREGGIYFELKKTKK